MLPHPYELPAAILLLAGGALACFAGYRLFRVVLAIFGFIFGAMLTSSIMGLSNSIGMIIAAIVGGAIGALIFTFAYFVGIALVGAGLGAFVAHVVWGQTHPVDPPALLVIGLSVVGAVLAMWLQRYVIVVGTSFGGAWTMIVGALAAIGQRAAPGASAADVWILYPFSPAPGSRWIYVVWIVLGFLGMGVQFGVTARK